MRSRAVAVPIAAFVASGALAAPTALAGAGRPTIAVTPRIVDRGHVVRVHGIVPGCPLGDQVTLISKAFVHRHEFAGVPAVFARVESNGGYSVLTRIPSTRKPGRYTITGRCGGGNLGVAASLRVVR
jgi:hypothetical protein